MIKVQEDSVRIPRERIAVLIGKGGMERREIEKKTKTKLEVDSETGEVTVKAKAAGLEVFRALDIVSAIGRGFSPEHALELLDERNFLEIMDLTEYAGKSPKALSQRKGRVIGTRGKARQEIEEITNTMISVYGKTIAIIGSPEGIATAKEAIEMLLQGATHAGVERFLQKSVSVKRERL